MQTALSRPLIKGQPALEAPAASSPLLFPSQQQHLRHSLTPLTPPFLSFFLFLFTSLSFVQPWQSNSPAQRKLLLYHAPLPLRCFLFHSLMFYIEHHRSILYPAAEMSHTPLLLHRHPTPITAKKGSALFVILTPSA